ncbi:FeoA family protein [Niveibacterium sp. COAC-50]|uniref:FeoA family protein n=1 Tax=Niveibacterium sp. COAC-50 TaxID=2729384 RepID=UPI00155668C9|nr:FeoA family protein [Niveibacterium sp. COAC-50]
MSPNEMRLADATPGATVRFRGFDATLDTLLQDQFLAYGIAVGQTLSVLQQRPLTIIQCDHTELAVESVVARAMVVAPA